LVSPAGESPNGRLAVLTVIPKSGPDAATTKNLVRQIRAPGFQVAKTYGITLGVTGYTALNIDMSAKLSQVFPVFMGIIVILSFIILMAVFRSLLVPLIATGGFMLSILATFGMTTAVFQWGWLHSLFGFDTGGPLLSFLPIMVTGILYGLAMDYQVFLVSSMREAHVHGHRGKDSIVHGFDHASRVVIAAAIIMTSVFSGFVFSPQMDIKQIGFGLAFGVLVDAFIVRSTLVPAVMALFGDRAWWIPGWLDRILPNLDVEGDRLQAQLQTTE
jgi:RND superfamily putative drug exporter